MIMLQIKGDVASLKLAAFDYYRLTIVGKTQMDAHGVNLFLLMVQMLTVALPWTAEDFKTILGDVDST